jgi:serine/threonine protein kinase
VDFGTSDFICADSRTSTCAGTYYFMAPEVISLSKGQTYDPIVADIWSLGVTMFSMAYLEVPFQGKTL